MKARKKVRYANPVLHVVRKKATVLAIQLEGEESIDMLGVGGWCFVAGS